MDFDTFDNDAPDTSDADYFAFVDWLSERTATELQQAEGNPDKWRVALCRYFARGERANLTADELFDFLGISAGCILERAGFSEEKGNEVMVICAALSNEAIHSVALD